ncbi:DUF2207 domain-containing protein [Agromyces intestinalis]|uniref:DUF2207 domain-containing protein n=1 Tax=Agromyces intestinalis TaxID=2592652 RepID=A0A5C1YE12_9MICO|nr:DUF2207 domain-containing protein [Agromyces intestinalis]QEO13898.1 DUF2207 domain-containing protein [Agromyces intestinalis]
MLAVSVVFAVIGLVVVAFAIASRVRVGRLPRSLIVEYAPRRGSTVIGDAVLAGRDRRATAAALIDLAVRRKVRLLADTSGPKRATVAVELVDGASFTAPELALLEALFGPGHPTGRVRRFSKDRRAVGRRLRALVDREVDTLTRAGLAAGTSGGRAALRVLGVLGLIATIPGALVAMAIAAPEPAAIACMVVALAAAVATLIVTPGGSARRFTAAAMPWRTHLDGMRQYLSVAEADRIRVLQSPHTAELLDLPDDLRAELGTDVGRFRLHERLLPYAIVFGLERGWMSQLKLAYDELGETSLATLGDTLEVTTDLLVLVDAIGTLVELGFAVGDLVDAGGGVVDAVGGVFEFIGDLTP